MLFKCKFLMNFKESSFILKRPVKKGHYFLKKECALFKKTHSLEKYVCPFFFNRPFKNENAFFEIH